MENILLTINVVIAIVLVILVLLQKSEGGALGIGVADRLLMFEHSVYTVASPEACASILWRDAAKAPEAASALKITGPDLLSLGVVDQVLKEPAGGNNWAPLQAGEVLKQALENHLDELMKMSVEQLREARYRKFRSMGRVLEQSPAEQGLST